MSISPQLVKQNDLSSGKMSWVDLFKEKQNATLLPCRILNPIREKYKQREINKKIVTSKHMKAYSGPE